MRWVTSEYKKNPDQVNCGTVCLLSGLKDIQLIQEAEYLIVIKENFFATRYHYLQKFDGIPKKNYRDRIYKNTYKFTKWDFKLEKLQSLWV